MPAAAPTGTAPTSHPPTSLEPGVKSREEIIREVGEGILVLQLVGVHAGANPISGERFPWAPWAC